MDVVIRAAVIYLFVWLVLRALGKRELGELTAFELVLLFVIGDLVQQSITENDTSLTGAILAISTIAVLILIQSFAVFRWKRLRPVVDGTPVVLVHNGQIMTAPLRRERMTADDLNEAARAQGIAHISDVQIAVLEADGKVSFITFDRSRKAAPTESRET
jgi:uncharacterized membrane protein YcaP (DUF421 family)